MDEALLAKVEKQAWFHRYPRGWPLLLFLLVLLVTVVSVIAIEQSDARRERLELDSHATEIASGIQRRAAENIAVLRASAAFFSTRDRVPRSEFQEFVSDLRAKDDVLGSELIGWAERIEAASVPDLEMEMLLQGQVGYTVYPLPQSGDRVVPIVYLEPEDKAVRAAFGFNMLADPVRREAMEDAVDAGHMMTGPLRLNELAEDDGARGLLIFVPVFRSNALEPPVKGFVYSLFKADAFLDAAVDPYRHGGIEIAIYDQAKSPERVIAQRAARGLEAASIEREISVANRTWVLVISQRKAGFLSPLSIAVSLFGIILGLLLMFIGRIVIRRAAEDREVLEWLSRQAAIRDSLSRELNHRVKNTLANVISIVSLSRDQASDPDDYAETVIARVRALSATQDLLVQSGWKDAQLGDIVRKELAPYVEPDGHRVEMSGPEVGLAPNDALNFGLAIHELATNAAKYGALGPAGGKVLIDWSLLSPELAEVRWREVNGPRVEPPERKGFGRELIENIVAQELNSEVELLFRPGGVECRLHVPVRDTSEFSLRKKDRE